jgi:hypothetical protein
MSGYFEIFVGIGMSVVFVVFAFCSLWIGAKAVSMTRDQQKHLYRHIPPTLRRVYFWSIGIIVGMLLIGALVALIGRALEW